MKKCVGFAPAIVYLSMVFYSTPCMCEHVKVIMLSDDWSVGGAVFHRIITRDAKVSGRSVCDYYSNGGCYSKGGCCSKGCYYY